MSKPTEYVVEWHNLEKERVLAAERGCLPEDIDPVYVFEEDDHPTLAEAEAHAKRLRRSKDVGHIRILRRVDIRDNGFEDDGHWFPC